MNTEISKTVRRTLAMPLLLTIAITAMGQEPNVIAMADEQLMGPFKLWEVEKITDDIYSFRYSFYRNIFIVTDKGVIATDPLSVEAGQILSDEIAKITDQPVKYVAYTHSHWDHVSGGQPFKDQGAKFVAHERCAENFLENPNPNVVTPDITYTDRHEIKLGDKALEMFYFGPSHDNCLVGMVIKPDNLLFLADVANPPDGWQMFYNPAVSEDRVWNMVRFFDGYLGVIDQYGIETVIGGHMTGALDPKTGRPTIVRGTMGPATVVAERRAFWNSVIEATKVEISAGTPPEEIPDKLVREGMFADQIAGYDPDKMRIFAQRITTYVQTGE